MRKSIAFLRSYSLTPILDFLVLCRCCFLSCFFYEMKFKKLHGGDEEIRTPDPLLARQVLSQLSYTPINNLAPTCSPMPSPA